MSGKSDFDKDKIEAAFYAAIEQNYDDDEIESLEMEDDQVTVCFIDGSEMVFRGVNSTKLVASLAAIGLAQLMDESGARITIFTHNIQYITAEGTQNA